MMALAPSKKDTPRVMPMDDDPPPSTNGKQSFAAASDHGPSSSRKSTKRSSSTMGGLGAGSNNTRRQSSLTVKRAASQRRLMKGDSSRQLEELKQQQQQQQKQQRKLKRKANSSRNLQSPSSTRNLVTATMVDASGKTAATTRTAPPSTRNASSRNLVPMADASGKTTATARTSSSHGGSSRKKKVRKSKSEAGIIKKQQKAAAGGASTQLLEKVSQSDHQPKRASSRKVGTRASMTQPNTKKATTTSNQSPLVRSNSLDSKLSEIGDGEVKGPEATTKPSSTTKGTGSTKKRASAVTKRGRTKSSEGTTMAAAAAAKGARRSRSTSRKTKQVQRSNSLDSKLSSLGGGGEGGEQQQQQQSPKAPKTTTVEIELIKEPRPSLAQQKKASSKRLTTNNSKVSKRKSQKDGGKNATKTRPAMVRSNSLDSMLSNQDKKEPNPQHDNNEPEEPADDTTKQQRPSLSQKKASLKRIKSLEAKPEYSKKNQTGRSGKGSARPSLVRGNSLESMLSHLSKKEEEEQQTTTTITTKPIENKNAGSSKARPSLSTQKKASSRRFKSSLDKPDQKKRPSTTKSGKARNDRPLLVRGNSLDSMLSKLSKKEDDNSNNKVNPEVKPVAETNKQQRPSLSQKKASSKRLKSSLDNNKTDHKKRPSKSVAAKATNKTERSPIERSNSLDSGKLNMGQSPIMPPKTEPKPAEGDADALNNENPGGAAATQKPTTSTGLKQLMSLLDNNIEDDEVQIFNDNDGTGHLRRPTLIRSNSLDSKLDSLAGGGEEVQEEEARWSEASTKEEAKEVEADRRRLFARKISSRRSLVSAFRPSSRRSLKLCDDNDGDTDQLLPGTSDDSAIASSNNKRGRARGRRSLRLSEQLARGNSEGRRWSRRSSSMDSRLASEGGAIIEHDESREPSVSRRGMRRASSLVGNDTNHSLKMFMEQTAKEDAAAQEQKNAKREKLSNLQKKFQGIAKEQSKFTDTLLAKMSVLSRVPSVNLSSAAAPHGGSTPSFYRQRRSTVSGSAAGSNHQNGAAQDGRPSRCLKRGSSISNMAQRMKDLGSSFRMSKKQSVEHSEELEQQRRDSTAHLTSEIPLLMSVPVVPTPTMAVS